MASYSSFSPLITRFASVLYLIGGAFVEQEPRDPAHKIKTHPNLLLLEQKDQH